MTTAATSLLGLALPVTGELSGVWGQTVNDSITTLLDSAVAGTTTLSTDADVTLTTTTLAANQARQAILLCSGARTALRTITAPAQSKIYTVINSTTGGYAVKIVGVGPTTGVTIGSGQSAQVAWNGSDFVQVGASAGGSNTQVQYNNNGALAGSANLTFNGTTLTANALTVTNATTLSGGTANGVAYLNGSKVVTTGSALTFDGTNLGLSSSAVATAIKIDGSGRYKQFETYQSGSREFYFGYDSTSLIGLIYQDNNRPIAFGISGSEQMRLTSTGLGIGTSSPSQKLTVSGSAAFSRIGFNANAIDTVSTSQSFVRFQSTGADFYLGTESSTGGAFFPGSTAYAAVLYNANSTPMHFYTNAGLRMTLDSSGNLGLGVTPSAWSGLTSFSIASTGSNISSASNDNLFITSGAYYNGTNWIYKATSQAVSQYNQLGGAHKWYYAASGTAGNAITFTQAMTLDASGNLGLGTSSPSTKLHIAGNTFRHNDATGSYGYTISAATNTTTLATLFGGSSFAIQTGASGTNQFLLDASGNLGIGTSSPTVNLHVYNASSAEIRIASANIGLQLYSSEGAGTSVIGTYTNHALVFRTNATERARITSGGEVYIAGTTDQGAYNLQVNGTGVWGAGAYVNGSDARLKEEVQDLAPALDVIASLRPVTFRYKEDYSKDQNVQPGFIAQELQTAMAGQAYVDGVIQSGPQHLNVAYQSLIPLLTKAIQELKAEFDAYKATHP